jgi:hypothetical protein
MNWQANRGRRLQLEYGEKKGMVGRQNLYLLISKNLNTLYASLEA